MSPAQIYYKHNYWCSISLPGRPCDQLMLRELQKTYVYIHKYIFSKGYQITSSGSSFFVCSKQKEMLRELDKQEEEQQQGEDDYGEIQNNLLRNERPSLFHQKPKSPSPYLHTVKLVNRSTSTMKGRHNTTISTILEFAANWNFGFTKVMSQK